MLNKSSQRERLNIELFRISVDVTEQDRKAFMKEYSFTQPVVSSYLNGKVASVETAIKMLTFFTKKIQEREKIIKEFSEKQVKNVVASN